VKRGFTVLELLVASLLLGMMMSILTMIFNQSSIAWRTGIAGVADLDEVREKIADVRYKSDNIYVWENQAQCVRGVFDDTVYDSESHEFKTGQRQIYASFEGDTTGWRPTVSDDDAKYSCGLSQSLKGRNSTAKNYVVNVMSCGPDRNMDTRYDNIYSLPDDPNNW